ncbi:S-adenosylmethionine uptake transporter [Chromobacterium alkanivorans]|nr:DMT family transporter [Chromobacterium alkanivorans]MCS3804796.1 S-adenosylmethionine uptake transporter [Chromobacterium alkanivorans]MCS3819135.1 S-adenosylmethionine uptake transporter [Chromobacterium alkanivorans]MCS3873007.1 S-adenosylmethionine uptake transporter [Chromobacterium alkanivorans]
MTSGKWRLGSGWMVVAAVFFGLMGVFVKLGAEYFSSTELVFWRTLVGVVTLGAAALWRRERFATPLLRYHVQRGLIGYVSMLLYFYAIAHLPLSTAVTLNYTSPMFLALLSVVLLRERLPAQALAGLALGFVGVVLLLRPTLSSEAWLAGLLGVGSGLLAGWSYLHVRELGRQGEPEWKVVFYFALISTLGGLLLMLFETWHPVTLQNAWLLLGLGATATIAQLAMTRSYKVGRKLLAANLSYLTVVFSTLLSVSLWGDPLSAASLAAMGLIIVSGMLASRR